MDEHQYSEPNFDGVCILTSNGEKTWTWVEFVLELKEEAGQGLVQIVTTNNATTIEKGNALVVFTGERESKFWSTMDSHGWASGMHPRVVRRQHQIRGDR